MPAVTAKSEILRATTPTIPADNHCSEDSVTRGHFVKHVGNENEPQTETESDRNCTAGIH
jgi:hypothetical protein